MHSPMHHTLTPRTPRISVISAKQTTQRSKVKGLMLHSGPAGITRGGKSTEILYSGKSTITLMKFYLSMSENTITLITSYLSTSTVTGLKGFSGKSTFTLIKSYFSTSEINSLRIFQVKIKLHIFKTT